MLRTFSQWVEILIYTRDRNVCPGSKTARNQGKHFCPECITGQTEVVARSEDRNNMINFQKLKLPFFTHGTMVQ